MQTDLPGYSEPLIGARVLWSLPVLLLDGDELLELLLDREVELQDCAAVVLLHFDVVIDGLVVALQGNEVDDVDHVVPENYLALT